MNSGQNGSGGTGILARLKRIGAAVGRVQAGAHSKKDMIRLRRRYWKEFRRRLRGENGQTGEQTEEPTEEQTEEPTEEQTERETEE